MAKYRTFENYGKKLKFGDYLQDAGNYLLNNLTQPLESTLGTDFVQPHYKTDEFNKFATPLDTATKNIEDKVMPVAVSMATGIPGSGQLIQGAGKSMSASFGQTGQTKMMAEGGPLKNMMIKKMSAGGNLTEFTEGGTHEQNPLGGIPIEGKGASVEQGETKNNNEEYIYSDRLTIDKDLAKEFGLHKSAVGKSFAAYSKKLNNKLRPEDKLDKDTSKEMLERLTSAQESYKYKTFMDTYDATLKKSMGGKLYKMYTGGKLKQMWDGGPFKTSALDDPTESIAPINSETTGINMASLIEEAAIPALPDPGFTPANLSMEQAGMYNTDSQMKNLTVTPPPNTTNPTQPLTDFEPTEIQYNQNPIYDGMRYMPVIANAISGLKHDRLNANNYLIKSRIKAPTYNLHPVLAANNSSYAKVLGLTKESSAGNAGTYLANSANVFAKKSAADAEAYATKNNTEGQWQMQADTTNAELEAKNKAQTFQVDDWNMRSSEAAKNAERKAAEGMGQIADAKAREAFGDAYIQTMGDGKFKIKKTHKVKFN
jgi:hypothetical protein